MALRLQGRTFRCHHRTFLLPSSRCATLPVQSYVQHMQLYSHHLLSCMAMTTQYAYRLNQHHLIEIAIRESDAAYCILSGLIYISLPRVCHSRERFLHSPTCSTQGPAAVTRAGARQYSHVNAVQHMSLTLFSLICPATTTQSTPQMQFGQQRALTTCTLPSGSAKPGLSLELLRTV